MKSPLLRDVVAKCSSWDAFRRALAKKSEKEKGDLFEHLVRAYLQLDPEYATKLRKVWLLDEVPSALRKKLKLPGNDQGIDLIAETSTGEFWAIQCKYRENTARPIPWREISTFTGLAFGVCRHISFGLVCSTTERITHVLKHQDRIGFCALDVWQSLDEEFFARLRKLLGHKPVTIAPLKPRPHQKRAIADARKYFVEKKQRRGKLISPCGSGKSLTAYWIARDLKAKKILVAVPSLALIRQTLKVWLRESLAHGDKVEWICVCSDESAGRVEQDDVAVLRQDLGVPCLTDAKEIASWLKQKKLGLTVVFTTYQSGEAIAKAARRAKFTFDLGIMDEAHKTVGDGAKLFSHLLYEKNLPVKRRIFMTATERRYRGKSDKILSMDDTRIYGDTFHLLSFRNALDENPRILCPYRLITIGVSEKEVTDLIRRNIFVRPDKGPWTKDIESQMLASLIALRKAMRKYPIHHAVSFHSSVRLAEIFKAHNETYTYAFRGRTSVSSFHISGKTPTGTRARALRDFAEAHDALITNARCMTEGVDVPNIDCVMFADPRRSAVDIVQAVGRALRPAKGKKMGYVIVPIVHSPRAKPKDVLDSEEFQEVLTTLRALVASDDRIIEYFRGISRGDPRGKGSVVVFDIDQKLARRINLERFVQEIEIRCWNRLAKLAWRPFEEAREYAHSLNLKSSYEWAKHCIGSTGKLPSKPQDIPSAPATVYANDGWAGMGDWLGTYRVRNQDIVYFDFGKARALARNLSLSSRAAWFAYWTSNKPHGMPRNPQQTYATKGWKGWGDWLGTGNLRNADRKYRKFKDARKFARSLGLRTQMAWRAFAVKKRANSKMFPPDIPRNPAHYYRSKGWISWQDWLGAPKPKTTRGGLRVFSSARAFARSLGLENGGQWKAFCEGKLRGYPKKPADIPKFPHQSYAGKGWVSMSDWLGAESRTDKHRKLRSFNKARSFVRKLKIPNQGVWRNYTTGKLSDENLPPLPVDIPSRPEVAYAGKGWKSWPDWFGYRRKR
jgi:superfamily II DNA or RNA helicase